MSEVYQKRNKFEQLRCTQKILSSGIENKDLWLILSG